MKYTVEQLVFADDELEEFRLDILDVINRNHNWFRREAETILGMRIRSVVPVGDITNPAKFHEGSDVNVAFYIGPGKEPSLELMRQLQDHFTNFLLENIGTITPIVYT